MARPPLRLAILAILLSPGQLALGEPIDYAWRASFNPASSADLRALHEAIYGSDVERLEARRISDVTLTETDFVLHIFSGVLYLEPEIEGVSAGAYFEGEATISFGPSKPFASEHLERYLGRRAIFRHPVNSFYIFSLRPDSPLGSARASPPAAYLSKPTDAGTYIKDKAVLRKLGFNLTWSFLNGSSHALGATYVLFPMQEIRTERSEEARLLYANHPMLGVTLAVFGHDKIVELLPYKFNFASLVTYEVTPLRSGIIDVDRYAIRVSLENDTGRAEQRTTIALTPESDLGALRLRLTTQMQVSGVTDSNGNQIPFLQWEHLKNDPNFDQTVVVALPKPNAPQGEESRSITIESKGILFDSRFTPSERVTQLQDEDHWYPRPFPLSESDYAFYEIDLTYPKRLMAIGPGERVLEEKEGRRRRVIFRTTHPRDDTTFYFGEYGKIDVATDEVDVEYYHFRRDHTARGNAKRIAKEVARAAGYFSRELGPLDVTTWRATQFGSLNKRFLEGLVYRALGTGEGTYDDFFQSHRVAHQWWGTCVSASHRPEDLWLEEALAYYSAMEYFESTYDNPRKMWDILYRYMFRPLAEGYIEREDLTGKEERILGRSVQPLIKGSRNIYVKGPMVLRMLDYLFRVEKGEEALMAVLKDYLEAHRYQTTCMDDFQTAVEKALGFDLDWFFNQWVREGGIPVVAWRPIVNQEGNEWIVRLDAKQRGRSYRLLVPVYLHYPGGEVTVHPWTIDGESSSMTLQVPTEPSKVTLNDSLESLVVLKALL